MKLPNRVPSVEKLHSKIVLEHRRCLEVLVAPWNEKIELQIKVLIGIPFVEIIREVLRNERDLVIKATESSELLDRVFGSDDMHLLRKCPCPVLLVKSKSRKTYHRILAAVDVDIDDCYPLDELNTRHLLNLQILEMAGSLALSESAELHIVNIWQAIGEIMMQGGFIDSTKEEAMDYLNPITHLIKGTPRQEIPRFANKINTDIVIMGTVSRTGIAGFFIGNTAETTLNQIHCSVLAIKPNGFATPVTLEG